MDNKISNLSYEQMYQAVASNDENYDTLFLYAVKSTGIYCRPSCKSKTPKIENIEFFETSLAAKKAGYRPCKRCRSDLLEYKPMQEIALKLKDLIDDLFSDVDMLSDEINKIGLSRKRVVEIFKEEYGITPSRYVNELRYMEATRLIINTNKEIIDIAYLVGFGSLSAFYKFFKERAKMSPIAYRKGNKI